MGFPYHGTMVLVGAHIPPSESILYGAPLIPAGMNPFHWNLQESAGMAQESTGMGRNPQEWNQNGLEWTEMALEWTKMDILEPNLHKYTTFGNWSCDHHPYIALNRI